MRMSETHPAPAIQLFFVAVILFLLRLFRALQVDSVSLLYRSRVFLLTLSFLFLQHIKLSL